MSDSSQPHGLQPTRSSVHESFQAKVLEWVAIAFSLSKVYSDGKIANLIIVQAEVLNRGRRVYIPWEVF